MRYVALLTSNAVRGVQFCTNAEHDPLDLDAWQDLPDAEVYIGLFVANNESDATRNAALFASTVPENIRCIPIGEQPAN